MFKTIYKLYTKCFLLLIKRLRRSDPVVHLCSDVKAIASDEKTLLDWYTYNISSYSKYLNDDSFDDEEKSRTDFFANKFPQYTTADQSYYIDQSLAFIGLGYVEMLQAIKDTSESSLSNTLN